MSLDISLAERRYSGTRCSGYVEGFPSESECKRVKGLQFRKNARYNSINFNKSPSFPGDSGIKPSTLSLDNLPELCEGEIRLPIPTQFRRGALRGDERKSIESALSNLKAIARLTERLDWSALNILDYGCGVKFTQALIQYDIDVQAYVGMDVFKEMIQCLNDRVGRSNFHFYPVPFKNEMYNPVGVELGADAELPGSIKAYDVIVLQSVFTHFNPADFLALLHVLRRYAAADARMLFTCFIDNDLEQDFLDSVPDRPLFKAYYREHYVRHLLEETGWTLLSVNPPDSYMQHQFACEPL
ncbi:MAG: class I SAM-dependent methyltransferase [Burkholderiales bacterium]